MLEQYYNKETQTLTLPHDFNKELCNLPLNTKVIIFEQDYNKRQYSLFNQPVNNLPDSITHLTFGRHFNQPVNYLPNSITYLTFGEYFNQPVDNLQNLITHLTFGWEFNKPINNLPTSVREIAIPHNKTYLLKKIPFDCVIYFL